MIPRGLGAAGAVLLAGAVTSGAGRRGRRPVPARFREEVERVAARELEGVLQHLREAVMVLDRDVTAQSEAREAVRTSEQRHRTIVEGLHEGVVLQQADGQITACNTRAQELLGLTVEQMVGRTSLDPRWRAVHEDGSPWPGEQHPVSRALATGERVGPETMGIHTPDGALRWLDVSATPILDDAGRVVEAVASFVDVTARMEAEAAAQAVSGMITSTLEGLTEGVVSYDEQLVMRAVNGAAQRLLRLNSAGGFETAHGELPVEILDVDGAPLPYERWPAVVANRTGRPVTGAVMAIRHPGCEPRWLQVNASPLTAGRPDGPWPIVSSFADITDRVLHDRALVEAEQRVRSTFDAAPIGMQVAALDGTYVEVNQALCDLLGRPAGDLLGKRSAEVTHAQDLEEHLEGERRLLAGEIASFRMDKRYVHAAGHVVWTQMDLTLLRDADGRPTGTLAQIQDISDRRHHAEQLRVLADQDALTGLLNRRGFHRELERHVDQAQRYGASGALLMLDLDHFKYVNDTLGHKAGDELVVAVADLLRSGLRKSDIIARLGGDEFAVLLPRGTRQDAETVAQSMLRTLRERQGQLPTLGRLKLTASIGIAPIGPATTSADELLVTADMAMYDAKEAGRDQVAKLPAEHDAAPGVRLRTTCMERIARALEDDGFLLFAQPIHALDTGAVAMHELLLRMRGADGTLILPGAFLAVAERFELVQDIDRWVVDHTCELLRDTRAAGMRTPFALNVSARSLDDPDALLAHIARAMDRTGAEAGRLVVEITETAAVGQIHHARAFAQGLQELGCRLALDDFGAGFGSFAYLKHLPFDLLKIDGQFVTTARHSRPDAVIVRALRDMAHGLGRQVVAEYCTDEETLEYLRDEGVDFAQGFHLGRPAPAEELLLVTR